MPVDFVWTRQAREDLIEIYTYIGLDNPSAAERIFDAIQAKAELLIEYPRIGVRRPDIRPSTRLLVEGPYLILYETHPTQMRDPSTKQKSRESSMAAATWRIFSERPLPEPQCLVCPRISACRHSR